MPGKSSESHLLLRGEPLASYKEENQIRSVNLAGKKPMTYSIQLEFVRPSQRALGNVTWASGHGATDDLAGVSPMC